MCGIVGYIGKKNATDVLLSGLEKLEYRGYDSAGIAIVEQGNIKIIKSKGKLEKLKEKIKLDNTLSGNVGIGHTRWATHGEPNETNAHPHASCNGMVVVVHNGIIENYQEIKNDLISKGFNFNSQTDTEVISNLLEYLCNKELNIEKNAKITNNIPEIEKKILKIIQNATSIMRGSYAIEIIFSFLPNKIFALRKGSPLVIGHIQNETFIASDVPAILNYTKNIFYLDEEEISVVSENGIDFFDKNLKTINKKSTLIEWDINAAEKNGYAHFMLKEIFEEPQKVQDTINAYVDENNNIKFNENVLNADYIKKIDNIVILGCGSAFHVGCSLATIFEKLTKIPTHAEIASEFRYKNPILTRHTLVISISQSGETADTLAGINLAKSAGLTTLSIINVLGSSIARASDFTIHTKAGPEIAVATTKAYCTQLIAGYLLAIYFAQIRNNISPFQSQQYLKEIKKIPKKIEILLKNCKCIENFAKNIFKSKNMFVIGRGLDYATSRESALKMKEVSYINTEAFAAGELKHGTISLIENGTPVFGILTEPCVIEKTLSNLHETKSRGALTIGIAFEDNNFSKDLDYVIKIPKILPLFSTILAVIPMQLLSYYVSLLRGNDIDKPRNLAKSVTVE